MGIKTAVGNRTPSTVVPSRRVHRPITDDGLKPPLGAVGTCIIALLLACVLDVTLDSQLPDPEGAMGTYPLPMQVGMTQACPGFVLSAGSVSAADHEADEGIYNLAGLTLMVPPDGIPASQLRERRGKRVSLVLRDEPTKELRKVER